MSMSNIAYPVWLGTNRQVTLYLPEDLTKKEAEKLAKVIEALAIEDSTKK